MSEEVINPLTILIFPIINLITFVLIQFFSMGGHGALICALKNPGKYRTVSAFAPICNPSAVPWGQKAFEGYLGSQTNEAGENVWADWDATHLVDKYSGPPLEILIDQVTSPNPSCFYFFFTLEI